MTDTITCIYCNNKPCLIPEKKGLEKENPDIKKDYKIINCKFKDYCKPPNEEQNSLAPFLKELTDFLKEYPQPVCFVDENLERLALSSFDLSDSVFIRCNFKESNFSGVRLSNGFFYGSILNNSNFSYSNLENCCFFDVQANYSIFSNSNLRNFIAGFSQVGEEILPSIGKLKREWFQEKWLDKHPIWWSEQNIKTESLKWTSEFQEALFTSSDLTKAVFAGARMSGTGFNLTRLQHADFNCAKLEDCSFQGVSLGRTNFQGAQLDRADFSSAFTPDPPNGNGDQIAEAFVDFSKTDLHGANFKECYFLQSDFSEVNARRVNWDGTTFGPGSKFSGDFSNNRFRYCDFIRCNLGREANQQESAIPVDLRDADFSHAYFVEVQFIAIDLDSVSFGCSRFEKREKYKKRIEELNVVTDRQKLIVDYLDLFFPSTRDNEVTGLNVIEPSAMVCSGTTFGHILFKNIKFLTADFSNSSIVILKDSRCLFMSCDFENASIHIPDPVVALIDIESSGGSHTVSGGLFMLSSFKNSYIEKSTDYKFNTNRFAFDRCFFNSTAFVNFPGEEVAFILCVFNQTRFEQFSCKGENFSNKEDRYKYGLSKIVLHRCRLMDGQYFEYLNDHSDGVNSSNHWKSWIARQHVLLTIYGIVKETIQYADDTKQFISKIALPNPLSDRQYLWNMFANNFKELALTDLESECIARVKHVDLFPEDEPLCTLAAETLDWSGSAIKVLILFLSCLACSAALASLATIKLNSFWQGACAAIGFAFPLFYIWRFLEWQTWRIRVGHAIYFYGEKIPHALVTWMLVILSFSFFYWGSAHVHELIGNGHFLSDISTKFCILQGDESIFKNGNGFVNSVYFSAVTFTTLGFGDLHPVGLAKFYAALEACIGAVLMALFVLSIARRTAAR